VLENTVGEPATMGK